MNFKFLNKIVDFTTVCRKDLQFEHRGRAQSSPTLTLHFWGRVRRWSYVVVNLYFASFPFMFYSSPDANIQYGQEIENQNNFDFCSKKIIPLGFEFFGQSSFSFTNIILTLAYFRYILYSIWCFLI